MLKYDELTGQQLKELVDNETLVRLVDVKIPLERGMLIAYKAFEEFENAENKDRVTAVYPVSSSLYPYCENCQTYIYLAIDYEGNYTIDNFSNHKSLWINNPPVFVEINEKRPRQSFVVGLTKKNVQLT